MSRSLAMLLLLALAGCPTPMVYQPNRRMLERHDREEAARRLVRIMQSSRVPLVSEAAVGPERITYVWQRHHPRELRWAEIERVDIYPNNKVFVYSTDGRELAWFLLPRRLDCTRFADLLISLRDAAR